jgi:signal peptidase II
MVTKISIRFALTITIAATVDCDRVTKYVARSSLDGRPARSFLADSVRFVYVENTGAFLSLGADWPAAARTAFFTVGSGVMLLALAAVAIRLRRSGWPAFGLTLLVAGGMSNWFDRAVWGSVVDFLSVGVGPLRTGIFNIADAAIMLGVGILGVCEFRRGKPGRSPAGDGLS